jgi:hypothetical protein
MISRGFQLPAYTEWLSTTEGDVILSSESSNESISLSEGSDHLSAPDISKQYDANWSDESVEGDTSTESVFPTESEGDYSTLPLGLCHCLFVCLYFADFLC